MKQKILFLFLVFLRLTFANAQTFADNGINYNVTSATTVEVGDNNGFSGDAIIPATVMYNSQSYNVTRIGDTAFGLFSNVTSITIPNSVTSIGNNALENCNLLTSIAIPNSVTTIGDSAFKGCSGLTSIVIPNSVTAIGPTGFYGCSGLTSITIPNSITSIDSGVFANCTGLTSVTIPNSVTTIGDSAFLFCTGLTSVTIPNSVTSIGVTVFDYCTGLTTVTIPESVTSIGDNAFEYCSSLTTVNCYIQNPIALSPYVFSHVNQAACALNVPIGSQTAYQNAAVWQNFNPINGNLLSTDSFVKNNFAMYPNPSSDVVYISLDTNLQLEKVNIYNQLGQLVKTATTPVITTSELAKGNYYVEVITHEGKTIKQLVTY